MIRICKGCNKEFITANKVKKYCSKQCKSIYMLTDKYHEERSAATRLAMNKPSVKRRQRKAIKAALNKPEIKEKHRAICKIIQNKPEVKRKIKESLAAFYNDKDKSKEVRKVSSDQMRKVWNNEKSRKKRIKALRDAYKDPVVIAKLSNDKLKFWKNESNASRMFISKSRDYSLPSGKIVKVQGYEDRAIAQLLQTFEESDLVIGVHDIGKFIGKILYTYRSKIHRYFPDIFIKSQNKIIEVKSKWSYRLHQERNEIKRTACLQKGFNFEFMIL
jgi:hypothetical protein